MTDEVIEKIRAVFLEWKTLGAREEALAALVRSADSADSAGYARGVRDAEREVEAMRLQMETGLELAGMHDRITALKLAENAIGALTTSTDGASHG